MQGEKMPLKAKMKNLPQPQSQKTDNQSSGQAGKSHPKNNLLNIQGGAFYIDDLPCDLHGENGAGAILKRLIDESHGHKTGDNKLQVGKMIADFHNSAEAHPKNNKIQGLADQGGQYGLNLDLIKPAHISIEQKNKRGPSQIFFLHYSSVILLKTSSKEPSLTFKSSMSLIFRESSFKSRPALKE